MQTTMRTESAHNPKSLGPGQCNKKATKVKKKQANMQNKCNFWNFVAFFLFVPALFRFFHFFLLLKL